MSFTDFFAADNPFVGLNVQPYGGSPWTPQPFGSGTGLEVWDRVPPFSTEGMIGENVGVPGAIAPGTTNPAAAAAAAGGATADTDVSAAGQKKASDLQKVLSGLKAPPPPQQQAIRSPSAPERGRTNTSLSTLLASMGISPQMLRLGETMGRGR